jgi:ATP-dependent helicase/nuclease subunit A
MNIRFISAGAGSGKTYRLTKLLSERLASKQIRPEAVVATTFTKKAAAELVERVRQRLITDGHHVDANSMRQALIGTVNSVCGQLLGRYAFEAGLSPHLAILGEQDQPILFAHALEQAMMPKHIHRMNALGRRLGFEDWRADVKRVVDHARANGIPAEQFTEHARRSAEELLDFFPAETGGDLEGALRAAVTEAIQAIAANGDTTKETGEYLDLLRNVENQICQERLDWSAWVRLTNKKPTKRSQALAERVQEAAAVYDRHPRLHRDLRDWIHGVFELAQRALEAYQALKAERGLMDFVDQEYYLLQLLDRPEVADSVAQELDLLLVDEFQDTSPIQLALFLQLAVLADECIWVGDVKQAIYGFRGTDPELMNAVVDALEGSNRPVEILPSSWRARPALVELTNSLFTPAFADYLPAEQIRLKPERKEVFSDPALRFWEVHGKNLEQRAAALAAGVSALLTNGATVLDRETQQPRSIRPGDIAILSRTNDGARRYASALTVAGLTVSRAQPGLLATPEVHLTVACLRRLVDAGDTLASAEIIALKTCGAPEDWLQNRLDYLAEGRPSHRWGAEGPHREPALVALEALRDCLPFLSPSEVLDEVLAASDVFRDAKAWGPTHARSAQRLANLETLRGYVREYEEHCGTQRIGATVGGFLLWLYDLAEQGLDQRAAEGQGEAVQVLTHHGAKGLEWPIVLAADLETPINRGLWGLSVLPAKAGFEIRAPLANRQLRYWPWPFGRLSKAIPVAQRIEDSSEGAMDRKTQTREAIRLLYVSFTRARDVLILPLQARAKSRPWLEALKAHWLAPAQEQLALPGGGSVPCTTEPLEPPSEALSVAADPEQTWFTPAIAPTSKLPARLRPSRQPPLTSAIVGQIIELGTRLGLRRNPDVDRLGNALHNILAAESISPGQPDRYAMAAGVLARYGLGDALDTGEVLAAAECFREKLEELFKPRRVLAEWPVAAVFENGQALSGLIDLLLDTRDGWVVIDHKSFPGERGQWAKQALDYGGQLSAYQRAVKIATGHPVASQWIHFSVGGGLVEVKLDPA